MKNIAIIPVRAGSTRVKQKNFLDFFGKPLFVYTYEHALNSNLFDKIVISTESLEVLNICKKYNIETEYLRPEHLADGDVSLDDVCMDVLNFYKQKDTYFDHMALLWATSPMRDDHDIKNAYALLISDPIADAVIAVTKYYFSPYCATNLNQQGLLEPILPDMFWMGSHAWPETYVDCGSMSWVKVNIFENEKTWMPKNSKPYPMPRYKSVDLDTEEDLELLKLYFAKYHV